MTRRQRQDTVVRTMVAFAKTLKAPIEINMSELRKRLIATGAVPSERMPDFHVSALTATIARMRDELARRGIVIDRRGRVLLDNGVAGTVYHIRRHPKIASEVFDVPDEVIPPGTKLPKAGGYRSRKASA